MTHNPTLLGREFSSEEEVKVNVVVDLAEQLMAELMTLPHSRERSIAIVHLEESVMWANKTINVVGLGQH